MFLPVVGLPDACADDFFDEELPYRRGLGWRCDKIPRGKRRTWGLAPWICRAPRTVVLAIFARGEVVLGRSSLGLVCCRDFGWWNVAG